MGASGAEQKIVAARTPTALCPHLLRWQLFAAGLHGSFLALAVAARLVYFAPIECGRWRGQVAASGAVGCVFDLNEIHGAGGALTAI